MSAVGESGSLSLKDEGWNCEKNLKSQKLIVKLLLFISSTQMLQHSTVTSKTRFVHAHHATNEPSRLTAEN